MKFAEIIIKPLSAFGTPLKGDTIFGHFFWQLIYDPELVAGDLENWCKTYGHEPFVVFSSAFPRLKDGWLLPRPALPLHFFGEEKENNCFESISKRKEKKKKRWLFTKELKIDLKRAVLLKDQEATQKILEDLEEHWFLDLPKRLFIVQAQPHNQINRLSSTTGQGFAPYQLENLWFLPGIKLSIFALYKEEAFEPEKIKEAFKRIGETGFGRDASSGLGRFEVEEVREHPLPEPADTLYTLSPYAPQKEEYKKIWYQPFARFGRHGSFLVLKNNPFKEPVLMADEGAVLRTEGPTGPLVGRAVRDVSKAEENTLVQGYSIVLPLEGLA